MCELLIFHARSVMVYGNKIYNSDSICYDFTSLQSFIYMVNGIVPRD
jgi:hypothetical protein